MPGFRPLGLALVLAGLPLAAPAAVPVSGEAGPVETDLDRASRALQARDWPGAEKFLGAGVRAGDPQAEFLTGRLFMERGGPGSLPKAAAWYRKAALKGHVSAQYHLGLYWLERHLHHAGYMPIYRDEAFKWLRVAADKGDKRALYVLGHLLPRGDERFSIDRMLAAAGQPESGLFPHSVIGDYLIRGERGDEEKDGEQAVEQLTLAAEGGDRKAALELARLLSYIGISERSKQILSGSDIYRDLYEAGTWAEMAAEGHDDPLAQEAETLLQQIDEQQQHSDD